MKRILTAKEYLDTYILTQSWYRHPKESLERAKASLLAAKELIEEELVVVEAELNKEG